LQIKNEKVIRWLKVYEDDVTIFYTDVMLFSNKMRTASANQKLSFKEDKIVRFG
jgi:hypothetical protein